jgi:hypothetical protein
MTHELGPGSRALLDAAREGLGPDPAAIRRMRAKIDASIAGGAAGAGAATGGGALAVKLGVACVIAALAAGALLYARRGEESIDPGAQDPGPRVTDRSGPASSAERSAGATQLPSREAAPEARAPAADPEIEMAPLVVGEVARRPRAPSASPAAAPAPAPAPAPPKGVELAREVELVDQAMAALRRGEPAAALAAVRVHAAETAGAGQLAEDSAAIEIEALCRLRDGAVAAKLAAFDARWPESAQRSRLTARCP